MIKTLLICIAFSFPFFTSALEYSRTDGTFNMNGEISKGDYSSFIKAFASWDVAPTVFHINSPGGNLEEAMKIANFIATSNIPVWVWNECSSACVFIYASAVERDVKGKIGLHRPYFDKKYFSSLTALEAEKKYNELKDIASSFLDKVGVSQELINRMFSTNSKSIDYLFGEDANIQFGIKSNFYEEWLIAKCGEFTPTEQKVITSIGFYDAVRMAIMTMDDSSIPKSDNFEDNLKKLMDGGKLALALDKNDMLLPFREVAENHRNCVKESSNKHIKSFHLGVRNNVDELLFKL